MSHGVLLAVVEPDVKERPIIFSGPMLRAILEGRKTQTRRVVKPQPPHSCRYEINGAGTHALCLSGQGAGMLFVPPTARSIDHRLPCPYGVPGDRLWVREAWAPRLTDEGRDDANAHYVRYRADVVPDKGRGPSDPLDWHCWPKRWRSPIFMPRWASRLTLVVTDVRVQRLQEISEEDARAEGVEVDRYGWRDYRRPGEIPQATAADSFCTAWDQLNGKRAPWESNPYVWCVSFRRL